MPPGPLDKQIVIFALRLFARPNGVRCRYACVGADRGPNVGMALRQHSLQSGPVCGRLSA